MDSSAGARIAVVGAGVGGLTAAIALRAQGLAVDLYEQTARLSEVGAGVSLSANAVRLLDRLGLGAAVRAVAAEPHRIQFHHWRTGELFYQHPMGDWYRDRYGAAFYGLHRADLQQLLLAHLLERYQVAPVLNRRCTRVIESVDGVELVFADGTRAHADVVIGADGLRSPIRHHVAGPDDAVFSAMSCFRGLVPVDLVPGGDRFGLTFFLGPGRHLVAYPVRRGTLINFIAYVPDPVWTLESWSAGGDPAEAVAAFDGWNDTVTALLAAVEETGRWALYDREPLRRWNTERVTLLGDAAHPMLPHAGQGSTQAMEDAVVLAHFLGRPELPAPQALHRYESLRRPRTRLLQVGSRGNAACFQLPDGPAADQRNAGLVGLPENVAWIHGYDAEQDVT